MAQELDFLYCNNASNVSWLKSVTSQIQVRPFGPTCSVQCRRKLPLPPWLNTRRGYFNDTATPNNIQLWVQKKNVTTSTERSFESLLIRSSTNMAIGTQDTCINCPCACLDLGHSQQANTLSTLQLLSNITSINLWKATSKQVHVSCAW